MWAVLEGEVEVVDLLLEQGANVFIASTKPWDPPGHDYGFPRFSNALDILQIAMARAPYDEFHVPILLKLQPLFKVAEFRAVRDVPRVDPATGQASGHRLALTAGSSVVHVTEPRITEREYAWVAKEAGDNGLRVAVVQTLDGPQLKIAEVLPDSAAAAQSAAEEVEFINGGYCHPREPHMHAGLIVEKINGQTVSDIWDHAAQFLECPDFVDVELAQLVVHGYDVDDSLRALRHVSPFHGQMPTDEPGGMTTKTQTCLGYMEEARMFPKGDLRLEFTQPAATMLSGWMESPDADVCLATMDYQAETFFAVTVAATDEQGAATDYKVNYVCGNALAAACQQMRFKIDPKKQWIDVDQADCNVQSLIGQPEFDQGLGAPMRPESIANIEASAAENAPLEEPILEDGWTPVLDPGSGNTYYENLQLGETTWDPPYKKN